MKTQKTFIHFTQPLFGKEEKQEVLDALDSGWVTLGPRTKQFEDDFAAYVGAKYAVAVSSNTAGMHLSLLAAGIKPGDEVITTPFTFVATLNTIIQSGAIPVLVDIDEKTFNIDPQKIEEKITSKTKAIMPVHYGGLSVDMDAIMAIAKKHNLLVIEDAAHATGASYKGQKIGTIGDASIFSFHPVKNMSTGDGGMVTTNNEELAAKVSELRLHGMSRDAWKRHTATGTWRYDVETPGFKYNMTDISAAIGIHQLRKLDRFIQKRKEYANMFDKAFADTPEISIPYIPSGEEHIYSLYTIKINTDALKISRDEMVNLLKQANVGVSVYFIPAHYFTYYKNKLHHKEGDFPVTEKVFEQIISLPIYPRMTEDQVNYVIETMKNIIVSNRKDYTWSIDNFDTSIFGFNVAKIKEIYANGDTKNIQRVIGNLQKEMKKQNVQYAVYRIPADKYMTIQALEDSGFVMVDGMMSLQTEIKDDYEVDIHIRKAKKKDLESLKVIASTVFRLTRVYNDTFLDKVKAGQMYAQWIENSVNGKAADAVLVYEENDQIRGFVTLQKKNGHIPLIAVTEEAQGKGIAKALVKAALQQIKEWGGKVSEIETQTINIPAFRAYQACGFKLVDSSLTFRWAAR